MPEKNKCNCEFCELNKLRTQALESENIEFVKKILKKFTDLTPKLPITNIYWSSTNDSILIIDGCAQVKQCDPNVLFFSMVSEKYRKRKELENNNA